MYFNIHVVVSVSCIFYISGVDVSVSVSYQVSESEFMLHRSHVPRVLQYVDIMPKALTSTKFEDMFSKLIVCNSNVSLNLACRGLFSEYINSSSQELIIHSHYPISVDIPNP
jgi:hypothetical protein